MKAPRFGRRDCARRHPDEGNQLDTGRHNIEYEGDIMDRYVERTYPVDRC